jgi:adenine-specific DNA-methyltransferase
LICRRPCVLVQRTTAKEQQRRLVACAVPAEFLEEWGGIVVENHVNVLRSTSADAVAPEVMAAVLNSETVDQLFRCLSGSVAVSATELHALPLPGKRVLKQVETRLRRSSDPEEAHGAVERILARVYGSPRSSATSARLAA